MIRTIVYDDFSGGDTGRQRPEPNILNKYRGINTWLYPAGIGPRPAIGTDGGAFTNGLPVGKQLRTVNFNLGSTIVWSVFAFSDGTVYSNSAPVLTPSPQVLRGTLGGIPVDSVKATDVVAFVTASGSSGVVNSAGTFTVLAAMPNGQNIEVFGDRAVVLINTPGLPPTLRFSDAADPTVWNVINSQFVGPIGYGMGLYVLRDGLIIPKLDGTIWQFAGVINFNDTLRQIDVGRVHPFPNTADGATVGGSQVFFATGNQMAAFTGAQVLNLTRPDIPPPAAAGFTVKAADNHVGRVIPLQEDQHFLVIGALDKDDASGNRVPWMQSYSPERGWNRHTVPVTPYKISTAALQSVSSTSIDSARAIMADFLYEGYVALVVPSDSAGGTNGTVRVYLFNTLQEMPYLTRQLQWAILPFQVLDGDTGTAVVASVQFAEWWTPDGSEVTVRSVLMDYTYDSDPTVAGLVAVPNRLTMSILATEPADGTVVQESAAITFTPTGGTAIDVPNDTTLKRGRELFQFGEQGAAGGFRIKITGWSGIVIRRLTVEVDVAEARH